MSIPAENNLNTGGIVMADIPMPTMPAPTPTPALTPASPVSPSSDTMVIPPASPLIPEGINKEQTGNTTGNTLPTANPWPKRLMVLTILILVLVGIGIGVKYALGLATQTKETTITYWGLWENKNIIQPIIDEFQATNPKIKVRYEFQSHKQYKARLENAIAQGTGPDVFRFHNTWVAMLKDSLEPVPTTVMSASEFATTFYPVATNDLVGGSTIYGIPMMIDGLGLYYNEEIFEKAGVTAPPSTWEELLAMVPKIAKADGTGFSVAALAIGTTGNVENFSDILATMFMQNGADLVNPTSKAAEETLMFYKKFANPADPVYTWNETMDNSIYAFSQGKVAMILAPSWRAFDIKEMNPTLRFKIAAIPQLPGNTVTWASYWVEGVSAKSKNQTAAWEFMKFLTSRETMTKLFNAEQNIRLFGEPFARVDMGATVENDPYVGAYIKQAKTAKSFPLSSRTHDEGLNDNMIKYLLDAVNAMTTGSSATKELETMNAGFQQVLGRYGLVSAAPGTN